MRKQHLFFAMCTLGMCLLYLFSRPLSHRQSVAERMENLRLFQDTEQITPISAEGLQVLSVSVQEIRTLLLLNKSTGIDSRLNQLAEELARLKDNVNAAAGRDGLVLKNPQVGIKPNHSQFADIESSDVEADDLFHRIRVLCYIPCSEEALLDGSVTAVLRTWGRRCTKIVLYTKYNHTGLPTVGLGLVENGSMWLTAKVFACMAHLHNHYVDDYDWFLKADADTYVIMENLRYFLKDVDANEPIYFGRPFKPALYGNRHTYMSGGAGYVMSREVLRRFGARPCNMSIGAEDLDVGRCMTDLRVSRGNTRDKFGNSRFHCMQPEMHISGEYPEWFFDWDHHGAKYGIDSMSDYAISFHWVDVYLMYAMEYYIYHLRLYGAISDHVIASHLDYEPPAIVKSTQRLAREKMERLNKQMKEESHRMKGGAWGNWTVVDEDDPTSMYLEKVYDDFWKIVNTSGENRFDYMHKQTVDKLKKIKLGI